MRYLQILIIVTLLFAATVCFADGTATTGTGGTATIGGVGNPSIGAYQ